MIYGRKPIMDSTVLSFTASTIIVLLLSGTGSTSTSDNDNPISHVSSRNINDTPGEPLTPSDFKNAERLPSHYVAQPLFTDSPTTDEATERTELFEGDIVLDSDDGPNQSNDILGKNAIRDENGKWKNGTVPYLISSKFNERERSVIARAVLEFQQQTCITFVPRGTERDHIMITTGDGCSSRVGRTGGVQFVTLGNGCVYSGIVMHELMHVVGFWHEQSRWDRDDHVIINFENVQTGMEDNFRKTSSKETQNLNASYDTFSIMHYGPYAFSKNRQKNLKTIIPKVSNDNMGQRVNFSEVDVYKVNKLYNCDKKLDNSETNTGTENSENEVTQPPGNSHQCTDNHHNCQQWAREGECQKNPNWMMVNCKQSCNQCRSSCADNNKHCDTWAANGECSKNPGYMNAHCTKACKKCR